jgi:hypothetical protein
MLLHQVTSSGIMFLSLKNSVPWNIIMLNMMKTLQLWMLTMNNRSNGMGYKYNWTCNTPCGGGVRIPPP